MQKHTAFLNHPKFRKTMATFLPDHMFYHAPHYPVSDDSTQAPPYPPQEGDPFSLFDLGLNTDTVEKYNVNRTGTLSLQERTITYSLETEILHHPNLSNLGISHSPIPTTPDHPAPGLTVYNGGDPQSSIGTYGSASNVTVSNNASLQKDIPRQQLDAAAYGNLPQLQEIAHGRNLPTDAIPLSGVDPGGSGDPTYLAAGTASFATENALYAAHAKQPIFSTQSFNSLEPPQDYDPLNTSIPHSHFPDTILNQLGPSEISNSSYTFNPDLPDPRLTKFNGLERPDISTYSHTSTPQHITPNTSIPKCLGSSSVRAPSHKSTARCSGSNTKNSNSPGSLRILANRHLAPLGEANKVRRSRKRRGRRVNSQVRISNNFNPSHTSGPCHLVGNTTSLKSTKPLGISIRAPLGPDIINVNGLSLSNISVKDGECKTEEDMFNEFTNHYKDIDPDFSIPERAIDSADTLNVPNVDNNNVPDAVEPHAGQLCTGPPVGDVGSVEVPQPRNEREQRNKDRGRPKKAKTEGQHRSTRDRRKDPMNRYFCAIPTCNQSRQSGSMGFSNQSDMARHVDIHGPKMYRCPLPHTKGPDVFRRPNNLKEFVSPTSNKIWRENANTNVYIGISRLSILT